MRSDWLTKALRQNENNYIKKNQPVNMLLRSVAFGCLLFISAFVHAQEEIILKRPTTDIHGTILTPANTGKMPVVLIIAGSGPTDRNGNNSSMENNSLKMLAEELSKNGIASVRFDKRGIGESNPGMDITEMKLSDFV